jgi:hypothetical protein
MTGELLVVDFQRPLEPLNTLPGITRFQCQEGPQMPRAVVFGVRPQDFRAKCVSLKRPTLLVQGHCLLERQCQVCHTLIACT